eukprot:TRINITY_DN5567_c2_g1_i1.p1 TRINITY_DN5567_c2_g1~~TRINITY_DN5567_c2_g1_i1.p1  ORF type:complete len:1303 (+),score=492.39 TRINITY_DN5567_c2_g1_i1:41-3910(+)
MPLSDITNSPPPHDAAPTACDGPAASAARFDTLATEERVVRGRVERAWVAALCGCGRVMAAVLARQLGRRPGERGWARHLAALETAMAAVQHAPPRSPCASPRLARNGTPSPRQVAARGGQQQRRWTVMLVTDPSGVVVHRTLPEGAEGDAAPPNEEPLVLPPGTPVEVVDRTASLRYVKIVAFGSPHLSRGWVARENGITGFPTLEEGSVVKQGWLTSKCRELEATLAAKEEECSQAPALRTEMAAAQRDLAALQLRYESLLQENAAQVAALEEQAAERTALAQQLARRKTADAKADAPHLLSQRCDDLERALADKTEECAAVRGALDGLAALGLAAAPNNEGGGADARAAELECELATLQARHDVLVRESGEQVVLLAERAALIELLQEAAADASHASVQCEETTAQDRQLAELHEVLDTLRGHNDALLIENGEQLAELKQERRKAAGREDDLAAAAARTDALTAAADAELEELRGAVEAAAARRDEEAGRADDLAERLEALAGTRTVMEDQLEAVQAAAAAQADEAARREQALEADLVALQTALEVAQVVQGREAVLEAELEALKAGAVLLEGERDALRGELAERTAADGDGELAELRDTIDALQSHNASLLRQVERTQKREGSADAAAVEGELAALRAHNAALAAENREKQAAVDEHVAGIARLTEEGAALRARVAQLEEAAVARDEVRGLPSAAERELESQLAEAKVQVQEHAAALVEKDCRIRVRECEIRALSRQQSEQQTALDAAEGRLAEAQADLTVARAAHGNLEARVDGLQAEHAAAMSARDDAVAQLEAALADAKVSCSVQQVASPDGAIALRSKVAYYERQLEQQAGAEQALRAELAARDTSAAVEASLRRQVVALELKCSRLTSSCQVQECALDAVKVHNLQLEAELLHTGSAPRAAAAPPTPPGRVVEKTLHFEDCDDPVSDRVGVSDMMGEQTVLTAPTDPDPSHGLMELDDSAITLPSPQDSTVPPPRGALSPPVVIREFLPLPGAGGCRRHASASPAAKKVSTPAIVREKALAARSQQQQQQQAALQRPPKPPVAAAEAARAPPTHAVTATAPRTATPPRRGGGDAVVHDTLKAATSAIAAATAAVAGSSRRKHTPPAPAARKKRVASASPSAAKVSGGDGGERSTPLRGRVRQGSASPAAAKVSTKHLGGALPPRPPAPSGATSLFASTPTLLSPGSAWPPRREGESEGEGDRTLEVSLISSADGAKSADPDASFTSVQSTDTAGTVSSAGSGRKAPRKAKASERVAMSLRSAARKERTSSRTRRPAPEHP